MQLTCTEATRNLDTIFNKRHILIDSFEVELFFIFLSKTMRKYVKITAYREYFCSLLLVTHKLILLLLFLQTVYIYMNSYTEINEFISKL